MVCEVCRDESFKAVLMDTKTKPWRRRETRQVDISGATMSQAQGRAKEKALDPVSPECSEARLRW